MHSRSLRIRVAALATLACAAPLHAQDTLSLSLADAVQRARGGEEVSLAAGRVDAAAASLGTARAARLPTVRLNTTFNHVYENARAQAVGAIFNQPNTYGANLNLGVPLYQGGRATQGERAARGIRDAARAELEATEADVSLVVLRAYLTALLADRLVAIQDSNLALADARLRQVEQFEASGRAARYDVLRARVERANGQPLAIQARGDRELALLELRRLTNIPGGTAVRLTTRLTATEALALAESAAGASASADSTQLAELPAVRAARLRVRSGRATARAAGAGYLPTVSLNLLSGYQAYPSGIRPPLSFGGLRNVDCPAGSDPSRVCTEQNGGWFSDRSLGLALSWPVFDGFRTRSDVRQARAQVRIAESQAAQTWENARVEAARTRTELESARAIFTAGRQTSAEAEEAFRLASLRFARGLGTQLEVSDAQLALLTARTNEARAASELYLAAAGVSRALGRPITLPGAAAAAPNP
ncbi:MAG TPA: TolC family protein [Longimicrobium sp.]|nr:TolC family protein [Longimicrobium sp.]